MKVTEPMVSFTKEEIPAATAVKKKWDSARKDYDSAISKVILLQKEKKPNPLKIQQAEQERDKLKAQYLQKGEEAFCSLLDANEMSEFATLEKMLTYLESFYQFFRGGYQFLRDVHDNIVISNRQWIAEERSRYEQRKKKRPAGEWVPDSISGGSAAKTRMFGLPYEELIRRDGPSSLVPAWLEKAIDHLEAKALGIQGVFRVSPPKNQLDETKKKIDSAQDVDWTQLDEHVCTGTIKLFLRELPQPLLTFELYPKFVAAADLPDEAAKVKSLKAVVNELPKTNMALLKRILNLMVLIERNKEANKMTASNLAVVLCPSILYPEVPDPLTMVDDIQRANRVMALMISHYIDLFGSQVALPKSGSSANLQSSSAASLTASAKKVAAPQQQLQQSTSASSLTATSSPAITSASSSSSSLKSSTPSSGDLHQATSTTQTTKPEPKPLEAVKPDTIPPTSADTFSGAGMQKSASSQSLSTPASVSSPAAVAPPQDAVSAATQTATPHTGIPVFPTTPVPSVDAGPKIDMSTMKLILKEKGVGPTFDYFMSLQELSDATAQFASLALEPTLSAQHVPALNNALKNLAKAIKSILTSLKDFATKLPPELRSRLLLAAKDLQDRVLSMASAFKELGEGQPGSATKLVEQTRSFVAAAFALTARLKEFSLVDELISAADAIQTLIETFPKAFAEDSTAVAVHTNSLQNASFKLTALLRAKILDSSHQAQVSALASCIESAEKETRDICDSIKAMLFDESLGPDDIILSPELSAKLSSLSETARKAEAFYEQLSPAQNPAVNNGILFAPTMEQLNTNIITHTANPEPTIQSIVSSMRACHDHLANLRNICQDLSSNRSKWVDEYFSLSQQLLSIGIAVKSVLDATTDPTVQLSLNAYSKALASLALQIRIISTAEAFDVQSCSDSLPRSVSLVKDFVFLSFPVLFNIRDAIQLIEEERNEAAQQM